jgi:hypothetical protein
MNAHSGCGDEIAEDVERRQQKTCERCRQCPSRTSRPASERPLAGADPRGHDAFEAASALQKKIRRARTSARLAGGTGGNQRAARHRARPRQEEGQRRRPAAARPSRDPARRGAEVKARVLDGGRVQRRRSPAPRGARRRPRSPLQARPADGVAAGRMFGPRRRCSRTTTRTRGSTVISPARRWSTRSLPSSLTRGRCRCSSPTSPSRWGLDAWCGGRRSPRGWRPRRSSSAASLSRCRS